MSGVQVAVRVAVRPVLPLLVPDVARRFKELPHLGGHRRALRHEREFREAMKANPRWSAILVVLSARAAASSRV